MYPQVANKANNVVYMLHFMAVYRLLMILIPSMLLSWALMRLQKPIISSFCTPKRLNHLSIHLTPKGVGIGGVIVNFSNFLGYTDTMAGFKFYAKKAGTQMKSIYNMIKDIAGLHAFETNQ
jgi:hypothetical protein